MERKVEAERLCADIDVSSLSDGDVERIREFAGDSKWEVRKVIAEALLIFPERVFRDIGPLLQSDSNAFVSVAARRASDRRIPAANLASSTPGKIQQAVTRITVTHGSGATHAAMQLAHQFVERHLKSAVHDIKNILTGLDVDIEKFQKMSPGNQRRKLLRIKQGTGYLRHLAEMMAKYSAEPELRCQNESLAEVVAEAHRSALEQILQSGRSYEGVKFTSSVPEGLSFQFSRFHIEMVLTNLIKNGIEAHAVSNTEAMPGSVHVEARISGDEVEVTVLDCGRGIDPNDLVQLREFIPGASSKRKSGELSGSGTGYGLPICCRYVESHGGRLDIDSSKGQGTKVVFRLPHKVENGEQNK
jgi:signal transduction histidine kinase